MILYGYLRRARGGGQSRERALWFECSRVTVSCVSDSLSCSPPCAVSGGAMQRAGCNKGADAMGMGHGRRARSEGRVDLLTC